MRVVGGELRGRTLSAPKGAKTRPTSDRVREALFDILAPVISGSTFLDAFAGSGAVGIEAASRGARRVVFLESDRRALLALRRNLEETGVKGKVIPLTTSKGLIILAEDAEPFDLVFMDPPYRLATEAGTLAEKVVDLGLLAEDGLLILEHALQTPPAESLRGLETSDKRRYGNTNLSFYRRAKTKGPK